MAGLNCKECRHDSLLRCNAGNWSAGAKAHQKFVDELRASVANVCIDYNPRDGAEIPTVGAVAEEDVIESIINYITDDCDFDNEDDIITAIQNTPRRY